MENLTILVVDDDPVIRRLLEQRLVKQHYQVAVAGNGVQAEALLRERPFDVVLTDLMMPGGVGGIEVLEIAKKLHPHSEVVLITAHSSVGTAVEAMKKGAADYLEKPINFDELFLRLDKIANLKSILRSAQDLEQAMTVTETAASQTIQDLEMAVARKQQAIDAVEDLLADRAIPEDERIYRALSILADSGH
jgi:DNA-binding NtrC family response regulator